jgi:hypothetical protein
MKNKTWLIIGLVVLVVIIFMIVRSSEAPIEPPETTTTTEPVEVEVDEEFIETEFPVEVQEEIEE